MKTLKLIVSIGFFAGSWLYRLAHRLVGKKFGTDGVILYYHTVPTEHKHLFAHQMDVLVQLSKPVRLDSESVLTPAGLCSAVTFDDGFASVLENALPELAKRNIPSTIFVTVGKMGKRADWWPESSHYERNERIASAEQLNQLPESLVAIGSHTMRHPMLTTLDEEDAKNELYQSRTKLETLLNRKVTVFSFPFGDFNAKLIEWCREVGYQRVFTSMPVAAFREPGSFAMGRISTNPTDSPLEFRLKVVGAYRWLPYAIAVKRRVSWLPW